MDTEPRTESWLRAPWHGIALLVVLVMPFAALGCEPSCDELRQQILENYKRCGITDILGSGSASACTEGKQLVGLCTLSCFENIRCAPEGGDNLEAHHQIYACVGYCVNFVYAPYSAENNQ